MKRVELTIAGVGGQGSILAGDILGSAAVSHAGLYAAKTQAYSSELRGGFAAAWLVIDSQPVLYPRVTAADILVAQAQDSLDRFAETLKPEGILIYDSDMIQQPPPDIEEVFAVAATSLARNQVGLAITANMVMLGALCSVTGIVTQAALEAAITAAVPLGKDAINLKAFELGMQKVKPVF